MTSKRLHLVMSLLIGLMLIGLVVGASGVNSMLTKESQKMVKLKAQNQALVQEQASLHTAKGEIKKYAELTKIAKSVVPEDKNQAEAVREIVNIAAANNIKLASVTFPASTLGGGPNGTASTSTSTVAPKVTSNSTKDKLSQLIPVKNISGVYQLTITVNGDANKPVSYDNFIKFLGALEHNRRTAQVSNITLTPSTQNRNLLTFSLNLNEYIKP